MALLGVLALHLFSATHWTAQGVQLIGAGSPNAAEVMDVWSTTYHYTRDDVDQEYSSMGNDPATILYIQGKVDYLALDCGVPPELIESYGLAQFPLVGQALVMAYNIPSLGPNDTFVIDRETLGLIWAGEITRWNDSRITQKNSAAVAAKLPGMPIILGYNEDNNVSVAEVVKQALQSFSPDFKSALNQAQYLWAQMVPTLEGRGFETGVFDADKIDFLQTYPYSMTYMSLPGAVKANKPYMEMYNKAGVLVQPNISTVQSALATFNDFISKGIFTINVVDANGTNSWPLSYIIYFTLNRNTPFSDCTNVQELMEFIAWTQTNDAASEVATQANYAPLDVSLRKAVIDALGKINCAGEQAYKTAYLVGAGAPVPLYTALSVARTSATNKMKYYQTSSDEAKQQLLQKNLHYGITSNGLSDDWYNDIPDAVLMPSAVYAFVPAFNLANVTDNGLELVLNFETIALIYLNEITMWNDERITRLNNVSTTGALPNAPITVITSSASADLTYLFTTVLARTVPAFKDQVVPGYTASFPVQQAGSPRSIVVNSNEDMIAALRDTDHAFCFAYGYDITLTRTLGSAALVNSANKVVKASVATLTSALQDYVAGRTAASINPNRRAPSGLAYDSALLGEGEYSWPLATFGSFVYRSSSMDECAKAAALADFFYWSQTSEIAQTNADRQGMVVPTQVDSINRQFLNQLKAFTCDDKPVSALSECINDGQLCSGDGGVCTNNKCVCNSDKEGKYCQNDVSGSDSPLGVILGVVIPVASIVLCALVALIVVLMIIIRRKGNKSDDWEIDYSELDVGEHLGAGGFGEVHRATWKGTEVAVKVMTSEKITKEMEKSFKDEVRVMTSLRHPNVVLFMAASTKAPKMCIVMEFMTLGSLYDLLHNELIPDIPSALKGKMAYQASKGMHFLHSSGIVHRDLKSLNLLLDSKWNVKVSDFGLTKFKEDVKGKNDKDIAGSVHWTAPEILNESPEVDHILADVYSFGIILWELLTREQPYFGMSPAAVAVAVIRDNIRPKIPEPLSGCPQEYEELITSCWHQDPTIRPTFLEVMTRLSSMNGDSSGAGASFTSKTTSTSSGSDGQPGDVRSPKKNIYGSWTLPSTHASTSTGSSSGGSNASRNHSATHAHTTAGVRAPDGEVTIVFTDITRAASLWEFNAAVMRDATLLHNETLRASLKRHRGYEVVFLNNRNSGEGSFCIAFQHVADALAWCADTQKALLEVEWPEALLEHPGAAEEWGDTDDRVLFKGLRVRMGVHVGSPKIVRDPMTRRVEYIGPVVNAAARITAMTHGGQIVLSYAVHAQIKDQADVAKRLVRLGKFEMPDSAQGAKLYELKVPGLESRFFGGVTKDGEASSGDTPTSGDDRPARRRAERPEGDGSSSASDNDEGNGRRGELQTAVGEGMMFKEDTFLTSANLCRWIIDFHEIQVGKQVGLGSYGVVFRGKWKGVDVAVKRFIKQKLDERRMLEFRAEMAFLSELHHPNIVLFIGACVKRPNLCIVTEFMKQGSLKDILSNNTIKLTWKQKMRMLRSAALGINYLHSLHPVIVHRDVKPSNLLVDENWNVKVADFGFARIKEENATMTRCGTPCWTAPEIIRGEKYDERADVFSFGIVMWQVVTRKEPFAGRNFMGVSLDVLEGKRPQIPNDCQIDFKKVMKKCWHASPDKRPKMEAVVAFLDKQVGDEDTINVP